MSSNSPTHVAPGRNRALWWSGAVLLLALLGWGAVALWGDRQRAWAVLLVDFLFLSSLAAGFVVWPAIVLVSRGAWMGSTQRTALAGVVLLPFCLLVLVVLFLGLGAWAPWFGQRLPNSWWLNAPFLVTRDLVALAFFIWLAFRFVAAMQRGRQPRKLAAGLIFTYAIVFSLLGIDLVMALQPDWYSLLFGVYFFISGLYLAAAGWTFATVLVDRRATPEQLHDLSKLIVAFSMLTAYMMFSQLLVIWYENMPKETQFLVPRMNWVTHWPAISIVLLAFVYLGPLILFLPQRAKRTSRYVGVICGLLLAALWLERWWLVLPSLDKPLGFGLPEITGGAALLAGGLLFLAWVCQGIDNP
jgi:hypothetical protein